MSTVIKNYARCDKDRFPAFHEDAQEWRESTTFYADFKVAELFGIRAVRETFTRAFEGWKTSAKYIVELCAVVNHLCWEAHGRGYADLSRYYSDCYFKCRDEIFKADDEGNNVSAFSDSEVAMMYKVLD